MVNHRPKEDVMESAATRGLRWPAPVAGDLARGISAADRLVTKGASISTGPPTVEEIIAVMRAGGDGPDGSQASRRDRCALARWAAGQRGASRWPRAIWIGSGARFRSGTGRAAGGVGRDGPLGMEALDPWLTLGAGLPIGALFACCAARLADGRCSAAGVRVQLRNAAIAAGVRRRLAPHQLRHARRCRDVARGCAAGRYPAAARACRPRGHVRVLAWHR